MFAKVVGVLQSGNQTPNRTHSLFIAEVARYCFGSPKQGQFFCQTRDAFVNRRVYRRRNKAAFRRLASKPPLRAARIGSHRAVGAMRPTLPARAPLTPSIFRVPFPWKVLRIELREPLCNSVSGPAKVPAEFGVPKFDELRPHDNRGSDEGRDIVKHNIRAIMNAAVRELPA